jgi:hypothetical protein
VLPGREVHEPVDPPLRPRHAAGVDVLAEQVGRVARLGGLLRRDVPGLASRGLEQPVPVRSASVERRHARNVTPGSLLCKMDCQLGTVGNPGFPFVQPCPPSRLPAGFAPEALSANKRETVIPRELIEANLLGESGADAVERRSAASPGRIRTRARGGRARCLAEGQNRDTADDVAHDLRFVRRAAFGHEVPTDAPPEAVERLPAGRRNPPYGSRIRCGSPKRPVPGGVGGRGRGHRAWGLRELATGVKGPANPTHAAHRPRERSSPLANLRQPPANARQPLANARQPLANARQPLANAVHRTRTSCNGPAGRDPSRGAFSPSTDARPPMTDAFPGCRTVSHG